MPIISHPPACGAILNFNCYSDWSQQERFDDKHEEGLECGVDAPAGDSFQVTGEGMDTGDSHPPQAQHTFHMQFLQLTHFQYRLLLSFKATC